MAEVYEKKPENKEYKPVPEAVAKLFNPEISKDYNGPQRKQPSVNPGWINTAADGGGFSD